MGSSFIKRSPVYSAEEMSSAHETVHFDHGSCSVVIFRYSTSLRVLQTAHAGIAADGGLIRSDDSSEEKEKAFFVE